MGTDVPELARIGSELPKSGVGVSDEQAQKEKKALFGDDKRSEAKKDAIHNVFIVAVYVVIMVVLVLFAVRMLQCILPKGYCWLTEEQNKYIEDFIFHGTVGGLLVTTAKQMVSSNAPSKKSIEDEPD